MIDDVDAARRPLGHLQVGAVPLDHLDVLADGAEVLPAPGGQIVQHAHLVAALDQRLVR